MHSSTLCSLIFTFNIPSSWLRLWLACNTEKFKLKSASCWSLRRQAENLTSLKINNIIQWGHFIDAQSSSCLLSPSFMALKSARPTELHADVQEYGCMHMDSFSTFELSLLPAACQCWGYVSWWHWWCPMQPPGHWRLTPWPLQSPGSGSSDGYAHSQRTFVGVNRKSAQLCKPAIVSHLKVQEAQYFWQRLLCSKCKTTNWLHDHHQCFAVVKILPQTQPANCSNHMYTEIMMVLDKTVLFCLGFRQTQSSYFSCYL